MNIKVGHTMLQTAKGDLQRGAATLQAELGTHRTIQSGVLDSDRLWGTLCKKQFKSISYKVLWRLAVACRATAEAEVEVG